MQPEVNMLFVRIMFFQTSWNLTPEVNSFFVKILTFSKKIEEMSPEVKVYLVKILVFFEALKIAHRSELLFVKIWTFSKKSLFFVLNFDPEGSKLPLTPLYSQISPRKKLRPVGSLLAHSASNNLFMTHVSLIRPCTKKNHNYDTHYTLF